MREGRETLNLRESFESRSSFSVKMRSLIFIFPFSLLILLNDEQSNTDTVIKTPSLSIICRYSGLNLAVVQARWYHTESITFILDYAQICSHSVTMYIIINNPKSELDLQLRLFNNVIADVKETNLIEQDHPLYDAIFFITPNDPIDDGFRQRIVHKSIYTTHVSHRNGIKRWQTLRLYVSPLVGYPFVLPAFLAPHVSAEDRSRCIVMVGTINDDTHQNVESVFEFLRAASKQGWTSKIFTRNFKSKSRTPDFVQMIFDASAETVFAALQEASFVLILPSDKSFHLTDRLTGILPLAISTVTPIITTTAFAEIYGLSRESGVIFGDSSSKMFDVFDKVDSSQYHSLVQAMHSYRNAVLRNNYDSIEIMLGGISDISSSFFMEKTPKSESGNLLPLSKNFSKRIIPEE